MAEAKICTPVLKQILPYLALTVNTTVLKSKDPKSLIKHLIVTEDYNSHSNNNAGQTNLRVLHKHAMLIAVLILVSITEHSIIPLRHLYEKYEGLLYSFAMCITAFTTQLCRKYAESDQTYTSS